jgi:methionyl-tRNA synthetase
VLDPLELKAPRCAFCGTTPVVRESTHWFFDLPKLQGEITSYIEGNQQFPDNARNFSKQWLSEGLKPRALTRDNKWGIPAPFPNSEGKTIYVWLEAVLGYVSALVEWAELAKQKEKWKEYWFDRNARNVHFIGKDNIPFHTIIFPALLLATRQNYVLPWQVASTEFILFDGKKFSKSQRIGVWIDEALEVAPADYWRYVLIAIRPEAHDANFTWREFESHVNSELNDVIGNFVHRTLTFIRDNFDAKIPPPGEFDDLDQKLISRINEAPDKVSKLFDDFKLKDALAAVVSLAREGNQYLSDRAPWHTARTDKHLTATTLFLSAQVVRALSILLFPFTPKTCRSLWTQLGLAGTPAEADWSSAGKLSLRPGHRIGSPEPLFHKVKATEIQAQARG